jgi:IPT/TIG domain
MELATRRFCLLFVLLFFSAASRGSAQGIALVQHAATDNGTASTSSVTVTLSGVAAGHLLTCAITYGNPGGTTLAVSDNINGAWSVAGSVHFSTGISQTTALFYLANSKAGTTTITGKPGSAGEYGAMDCQEWSGVATSSPLDQTAEQDGTTANPSSGSVTTTASGELILGDLENGYSPSAGSGFTLLNTDTSPGTGSGLNTEYRIQASAGAAAATWTLATTTWTAQVATFKSSTGTGGGTPPSITSLSPTSGPVGTIVTITGANFGATQGTSTVTFNGTTGTPNSWSASSITVPVPSGATSGNVQVLVGGVASNGVPFSVGTTTPGVTLTPILGGAAINQQFPLTATVSGGGGVTWSVSSGGTLSSETTTSVSFSAATAGVYTVTATSITNSSESARATIAVTNLAGVFTYHNDLARDGANTQEYALTPSNVNTSTFGKLFSCQADGAIYTQPLWVPNLTINGGQHNVVFVATQHDSLYAFDADANPCVQLWHVSLIDSAHGGTSGETSVPSSGSAHLVGAGGNDITPEVGVTGTPVIDPSTNTLYVVSKSVIASSLSFFQRLHAIDLFTGNEKTESPLNLTSSNITYPGTGDGSTTDAFNTRTQNQRPGLALVNGVIYIAWASHEDYPPYYGWIIGVTYNGSRFSIPYVLNVDPNAHYGGIWMSGAAPSADASNNLYLITGNGQFDATSTTAPNNDYGDSALKLTSSLAISQYFTPSDQLIDQEDDHDFGSGGAAVLADLPANGSNPTQFVIGGGKDGTLYLLNRDKMGGSGDSNAWQHFPSGHSIFCIGAFWNGTLYIAPINSALEAYSLNASTAMMSTSPSSVSSTTFGFPGASPAVSSNGTSDGIVWALDNGNYCTITSVSCGPTVLHAYSAVPTALGTDLWNSSLVSTDAAGNAVKYTVPTVANGKVYVGTRGNNTGGVYGSTSVSGELDVYGLKPN